MLSGLGFHMVVDAVHTAHILWASYSEVCFQRVLVHAEDRVSRPGASSDFERVRFPALSLVEVQRSPWVDTSAFPPVAQF